MPRFYIPPELWNPDRLALGEEETHHAADVLRMKPGDRAMVFNGEGAKALVEIVSLSKRETLLRRLQLSQSAPPACRITLAQAIPKGKNMDLIVQKAVELGAAAIVPLLTEHTVVQCDAREAEKKREKWQAVAIEACKQCGQNWLPKVHSPTPLQSYVTPGTIGGFKLPLIASLLADAVHPRRVLAEYFEKNGRKPSSAMVLIGPEGDFSPSETALAQQNGCRPITLGNIILRTETAALYCLSVLNYELMG